MVSSTECADLKAMQALAKELSTAIQPGQIITLSGDIGAGKTTLVRAMLENLGYSGKIKSPTFTLVESYDLVSGPLFHFDLYRLESAEELEMIGFTDYLRQGATCLIEWPEKAQGYLPEVDWRIEIEILDEGRLVNIK